MTARRAAWLFSLMCMLEIPLASSVSADMRALCKKCAYMRCKIVGDGGGDDVHYRMIQETHHCLI